MSDIIYSYAPLWGNWNIDELIGKGSIGNVYKISKTILDKKYISAVKFITVPTTAQYNNMVNLNTHMEETQIEDYFKSIIDTITREIDLLYKLKGHSNIITYEDHMVKKAKNENVWHIFIRMEHAKSLVDCIRQNTLKESDLIKLGIDICDALTACHENNIFHRDIKEANIFKSDLGIYKLGDFSVSRHIDNATHAQTRVGTLYYMAPEVINGKQYNKNADIYSLGVVLYKLLNKGRLPLMPKHPEKFTHNDLEDSQVKRLSGEKFDRPSLGNDKLINIILKACSFDPTERYQSATEMKNDLLNLDSEINLDENISEPTMFSQVENPVNYKTASVSLNYNTDNSIHESNNSKSGKKKLKIFLLFTLSAFLLLGIVVFIIEYSPSVKRYLNDQFSKRSGGIITSSSISPTGYNSNANKGLLNSPDKESASKSPDSSTKPTSSTSPSAKANSSTGTQTTPDAQVTPFTPAKNLIPNPGAESPNTNWFVGYGSGSATGGTATFTTETKYSGNYCLKIEKPNPDSFVYFAQSIKLTPGKKYVFSAFVKLAKISITSNIASGAHLAIDYGNSTPKWDYQSANIDYCPNWKYIEFPFQIPSSYSSGNAYISVNYKCASGIAYFDDMSLLESP